MSVKKPKLVEVEIFGVKCFVNVDEMWNRLLEQPFDKQLQTIAHIDHFAHHVDHLGLSKEHADRFIEVYRNPIAVRARQVAVHGLVNANYSNAISILQNAADCVERGAIIRGEMQTSHSMEWIHQSQKTALFCLGARLAEIVAMGEYKQLEQMAKILKGDKKDLDHNKRGGEHAERGNMFREFCRLHVASRALPTKKQLRAACGYGEDNQSVKVASDNMKDLGLGALPEAKAYR
jgi:hypothetical protein